MTELNPEPTPENDAPEHPSGPGMLKAADAASAAADVAWPELPQHVQADPPGHETEGHQAHIQDPAVSAVLDRLAAVRQTPVSGHGEVYAGMHEALLDALNEDLSGPAGVARRIHAAGDGGS